MNDRKESTGAPSCVHDVLRQMTNHFWPGPGVYTRGRGVDRLNQYEFIFLGSMLTPIKVSSLNYHVILVTQP